MWSIIGQMDEVLGNGDSRGHTDADTAIAALNHALRSAALGESYDYLLEDIGAASLGPFEAPAANDHAGGNFGASGSSSSNDSANDSGVGEDYPPLGGGEPAAGDDAVFGVNDGTGTDEPDMGICDRGGQPAWCLDFEPGGGEPAAGDDAVFGVNDGTGTDEPDMGICGRGGEPAWCGGEG